MFFKAIRLILSPILTGIDKLTSPTSLERTAEAQLLVDNETKHLELYQYPSCPFCIKVRRQIKRLGLKIELRDAKNSAKFQNELIIQGGKNQVPCLKISQANKNDQWLYESSTINDYLSQRFAEKVEKVEKV